MARVGIRTASVGELLAGIFSAFNQAPRELLVPQSCDFATDCAKNGTAAALAAIGAPTPRPDARADYGS